MKRHEIIWTEFAMWNLDQIYDYVLSKSFSEPTAHKLIRNLVLRVEQLQLYPNSGQQELELLKLKKNI
jgi:plasmid stabilization system protein ParE